ncbi:MAG: nuclear transport factor 2 family protein [Phaeodactylibacter sp.]|nr:nuclear transport factor 2 family protein [Phaeodactylibacter sp.]MCB9266851.1 nuclear transport factor 2 family protein [Lewinellaceae bacterium]MCB9287865.1 nuclear transport factor 2 family protein [Lewinellaceae bacterium]
MYKPILFAVILTTAACNNTCPSTLQQQTEQKAKTYFEVYSQRSDWNRFLSFYRDDIQFFDTNLRFKATGINEFKAFYNWPGPGFEKLSPSQAHLEVESLVVGDSTAVGRGHFNPFYWHGQLQEWDDGSFTIWLYFDRQGKIYRQYDFITYPAGLLTGENRE